VTRSFFSTVQNKLHWAITGRTAAELITERASADKPNMGLTSWKNAPKGKILKKEREIRRFTPDCFTEETFYVAFASLM
jgi:hypothetical protein